jgi:hypothetical protein
LLAALERELASTTRHDLANSIAADVVTRPFIL